MKRPRRLEKRENELTHDEEFGPEADVDAFGNPPSSEPPDTQADDALEGFTDMDEPACSVQPAADEQPPTLVEHIQRGREITEEIRRRGKPQPSSLTRAIRRAQQRDR